VATHVPTVAISSSAAPEGTVAGLTNAEVQKIQAELLETALEQYSPAIQEAVKDFEDLEALQVMREMNNPLRDFVYPPAVFDYAVRGLLKTAVISATGAGRAVAVVFGALGDVQIVSDALAFASEVRLGSSGVPAINCVLQALHKPGSPVDLIRVL